MKKLPVLCPQEYEGTEMKVVLCDRCAVGWDREASKCRITTGAEHLPLVAPADVPECPMQSRCQHDLQQSPCIVRARGLVCESALAWAGVPDVWNHPLGFNACIVAGPGELEEQR